MGSQNIRLFAQSSGSTSAYTRHLQQVGVYVNYYGGTVPVRKTSRSERDVLEQNHRFIRDDTNADTQETQNKEKELAKKYYDSLFKEYALIDLSRWKDKQIALRWRTKDEVLEGKGQFTCASLTCSRRDDVIEDVEVSGAKALRTFELNFAYVEEGIKKNALVKVRVCRKCTRKLKEAQDREKHKDRRRSRSPDHRDRSHRHRSRESRRRDRKDSTRYEDT